MTCCLSESCAEYSGSRFLGDGPTNVGAFARSMRWMLSFSSSSNASFSASREKVLGTVACSALP